LLIGCQTITFRNVPNPLPLPEVLNAVAAAGFDGVEIASRTLDLSDPEKMRSLLAENGLKLMALHLGSGNFDPEGKGDVDINALVKFGQALGVPYAPVSGMGKKGATHVANLMNEYGQMFTDHGMSLCFHNHGGEIENDFAWIQEFCDVADPANVNLVLDLGWAYKAGADPVAGLKRFASRVKYVHLKDQAGQEWTELGRGEINLAGIVQAAKELDLPWLVSEQDRTNGDPAESVRINAACLKSLVGSR
jgi:sugar phosphate isomerase/epimerase